jgi:hypothetical protein
VVIYDANNGTRARRQALAEKFDKEGIHVVMLGSSVKCCLSIEGHLRVEIQRRCVTIRRLSRRISGV